MACLPIVLESSPFVDGAEFIGLEVWQFINRGQDNTGVNKYFLLRQIGRVFNVEIL